MDPLNSLLQLQLASDTNAVLQLPYTLSSLTSESFTTSNQHSKWISRVNSLIHAKDIPTRWTGLCLALQTSLCSQVLMIECAQSWVGVVLPLLSRNESSPILKVAIRLSNRIFTAAADVTEFQRQLSIPNVPKFSLVLIGLADKHHDSEVRLLAMDTLRNLIPVYPSLHRPLHSSISALSLKHLNGSAPGPTALYVLTSASRLYVALCSTGGKAGTANLWRKSMDETISVASTALSSITAYQGSNAVPPSFNEDPLVAIPLALDRLRCCVTVLCDLLSSITHRPVQLPIGALVKLSTAMLRCTVDGQSDPRASFGASYVMGLSVTPTIWKNGWAQLIKRHSARHHLTPHVNRLLSYITYHLEQILPSNQRLYFLCTLNALLTFSHTSTVHSTILSARLVKAVLPSLTVLLQTENQAKSLDGHLNSASSKKGKKRARGYEGDEALKVTKEEIIHTQEEQEVIQTGLDVMERLLALPNLPSSIFSMASRVLLSILVTLPQVSAASLSTRNLGLHGAILERVKVLCVNLASGTTGVISRSFGIILAADGTTDLERIDLLLHPRVPPLVRPLPALEALSLFRKEEPQEEADARELQGLDHLQTLEQTGTSHSETISLRGEKEIADFVDVPPTTIFSSHLQVGPINRIDSPPVTFVPTVNERNEQPASVDKPSSREATFIVEPANLEETSSRTVPQALPPIQSFSAGRPIIHAGEDDEDDEEMPSINMESDSDDEP